MFRLSGLVCLSVRCNRPSGYWMLTVMASLYPAMKEIHIYIRHRRPRNFTTIIFAPHCLTVRTHLHLHLSNLTFPRTLSPILKWHPNKSKKDTDGISSQRKNSNTHRRTFKMSQKRRRRWSASSAAPGPNGSMALSFGTLPSIPYTSPQLHLTLTPPQSRRRSFHSPHLRRRLHTTSHHPAPLRRPRPPPQIPHDRRPSVLHEPLHLQRDNESSKERRLRQEFLDGTESQYAAF